MTLAVAVLVASLIGSVHCGAMCGAFVCFYGSSTSHPGGSWTQDAGPHAAYNLGRLVSYVVLGVLAGFAGRALDATGVLAGVQRGAAVGAGSLMIIWGAHMVLAAGGARVRSVSVPAAWQRAMGAALLRVRKRSPIIRAGATGLVTTLLPCGWLYTFVVSAAATGSASGGAFVMTFFWLGTLPMMVAIGLGARRLMGPLAARLPVISGAAVMVLGYLSISGRIGPSAASVTHMLHAAP